MATSSITKNFVVSGDKQVDTFANAIEESYQESLTRQKKTPSFKYRELKDPNEIQQIMMRWKEMLPKGQQEG